MIRINLLSEGRRPVVARRAKAAFSLGDQDPSVLLLATGLVLGMLVGGGLWWHKSSQIASVEEKIDRAQAEVRELEEIIAKVEDFKAKKAELETKIAVIQNLKVKQKGPVKIMDAISRALPELLWLDSLRLNGSSVTLRGRAFNTDAVARFIGALYAVPEFKEPDTREVSSVRSSNELYSFNLNFDFSYALPTPADADGGELEDEGSAASAAAR